MVCGRLRDNKRTCENDPFSVEFGTSDQVSHVSRMALPV